MSIKIKQAKVMYKFNLNSVDGNSTTEYDSLEKFAKDWTNSTLNGFDNNRYVTHDGITVITPADDFTAKAVQRERLVSLIDHKINYNGEINASNQYVAELVQMPTGRNFATLYLTREVPEVFGDYIETDIGRAFILDSFDPMTKKFLPNQKALEKVGLNPGSMTLKDTYVVSDLMAKKMVIFDTRNEASTLKEMTARAIVRSPVVEVEVDIREGFHDDGLKARLFAAGDENLIKKSLEALEENGKDDEHLWYYQSGYSNSKENPVRNFRLDEIINKNEGCQLLMADKEKFKESNSWDNTFSVLKITRELVNAAGSTERGFYYAPSENDEIKFLAEGTYHKLSFNDAFEKQVKEMSRDEVKCSMILTKEQERGLDDMPF